MVFMGNQAQPLGYNEDKAAYYQFSQFPCIFTQEGFLFLFPFRNRRVVRPFHNGHAVFHLVGDSLHLGGETVVAAGGNPELAGSVYQNRFFYFRHGFDGVFYLGSAGRTVQTLYIVGAEFNCSFSEMVTPSSALSAAACIWGRRPS